mgnify:FL=1
MIRGIGVSKGIALAQQYVISDVLTAERDSAIDAELDVEKLRRARKEAMEQLAWTLEHAAERFGAEESEIFDVQLLLLDSDELWASAEKGVREAGHCAEWAFDEAVEERIDAFSKLSSEYLRERVLDLKDIRQRVLRCMRQKYDTSRNAGREVVIIGHEVMPSQIMEQRERLVRGIVMEAGGATSHTVLLANMLGIPCVVGAAGVLVQAVDGEEIIIDGAAGEVILHPGEEEKRAFEETRTLLVREEALDRAYFGCPDRSGDGSVLPLWCNIAAVSDTEQVLLNDGGGVGLMRSEFLFLGRQSAPGEEEQYNAYRQMAERLGGKPLVIRTLDLGADKQVSYLGLEKEDNPALGLRAIRYCLRHEEIFLPQLRAILRAGAGQDVRMMLPMVASLAELRSAKVLLERAKTQLREEGMSFRQDMPIGVMIEVPSAAMLAGEFAAEADFFSIGTNDLVQYLFSADRTNPNVSSLNRPYAPALLRLVQHVARKGAEHGITVAICGHAGQDPLLLPLWLAMGIGELSVSPTSVLSLRRSLSGLSREDCLPLLERVLEMQDTDEVLDCLKEFRSRHVVRQR